MHRSLEMVPLSNSTFYNGIVVRGVPSPRSPPPPPPVEGVQAGPSGIGASKSQSQNGSTQNIDESETEPVKSEMELTGDAEKESYHTLISIICYDLYTIKSLLINYGG